MMKLLNFSLFILACTTLCAQEIIDLKPYRVHSYWNDQSRKGESNQFDQSNLNLSHTKDLSVILQQSAPEIGVIRKAGTSNDIVLRGLSQDNLAVTIDDSPIFPCCSNRMDPPISQVSASMLESIELTQGAFDLSHAGTLGGSIKVKTRDPADGVFGGSTLSIGSFGYRGASLDMNLGNSLFGNYSLIEYSESGSYKDGNGVSLTEFPAMTIWKLDDYQQNRKPDLAYKSTHAISKMKWRVTDDTTIVSTYRYRHDKNVLYPGLRMDADLTRTQELSLTISKQLSDLEYTLHGFHNWTRHDMRDRFRNSALFNPMMKSRPEYVLHRNWFMESLANGSTTGLQIKAIKDLSYVRVESGAEFMQRIWDIDNRIGAGSPTASSGAELKNNMIPNTISTVYGCYIQTETWLNDKIRLDAGGRVDFYSDDARDSVEFLERQKGLHVTPVDELNFSMKTVIRYSLNHDITAFLGIGSTTRIPNGQEKYIQVKKPGSSANWIGNPELKTPRNTETAMGVSIKRDKFTWNTKLFVSMIDEYIYLSTQLPKDHSTLTKQTQSYQNIDALIWGFDSSINVRFNDNLSVVASLSWQRGEKDNDGSSKNLGEILPLKGLASIRYHESKWSVSLETLMSENQHKLDRSIGEIPLDSYIVFNLRGEYALSDNFYVSGGIENLLDSTYSTHNAYVRNPFSSFAVVNEPGRQFYISFKLHF